MLAYADLKSKKCQSLDNSESKDERKMTWVDQTSRNLSQVTTIMPLFADFISQNAERSGIDILGYINCSYITTRYFQPSCPHSTIEIGCGSGRALLETQVSCTNRVLVYLVVTNNAFQYFSILAPLYCAPLTLSLSLSLSLSKFYLSPTHSHACTLSLIPFLITSLYIHMCTLVASTARDHNVSE